mgnify:CR=1 FL=1
MCKDKTLKPDEKIETSWNLNHLCQYFYYNKDIKYMEYKRKY